MLRKGCDVSVMSSPEHKVLRVSYCDCAVCVTHRQLLTCARSRGHALSLILMKLRMFALMKSQTTSKLGYVGSKIRSLGQILQKLKVSDSRAIVAFLLPWIVHVQDTSES